MTHPPQPPQPPPEPQNGPPAPPAPPAPNPAPPGPNPAPPGPDLEAALRSERSQREAVQRELDKLKQSQMTDQEKAVAAARAEGRQEAEAESFRALAAVQFEHAATGRIADPRAALELIDVSKLLGSDGRPDAKAIAAAIDRLAGPAPEPGTENGHVPPAHIPGGVRQPQPADRGDFIRSALRGTNRT